MKFKRLIFILLLCINNAVFAAEVSTEDEAFDTRQAILANHAMVAGTTVPAQLVRRSLNSTTLGKVVEYSVLLPDQYQPENRTYPLILFLHGAGGDREFLTVRQPQIESLWREGVLPRSVVVTVSAGLSFYMNDIKGEQNWETFILEEFLPLVQRDYNASTARENIAVTGISMGGFGSAYLAFRHPDKFGIVAMMEPVLWPALTWSGVAPHLVILRPDILAQRFGDPIDTQFFASINPASIAAAEPDRLRHSGLKIYLEVGDQDAFGFHEGAEFLHRVLWDNRIRHQYRLVRGADHIGPSVNQRSRDRFEFIGRYLQGEDVVDPAVARFRETRGKADESRGFKPFPYWPNEPERTKNAP